MCEEKPNVLPSSHRISVSDLKKDFNGALALAENAPIVITRRGKDVFVMLTLEEYQNITHGITEQSRV